MYPTRHHHVAARAVLFLAATLASFSLFAQDSSQGEAMAQKYRCYACHNMTDNLIGPPYQAIAVRHAGQKEVMSRVLATKIILGGGGNWGVVPMVPNEHVPEEDALVIARWILDQAP